MGKNSLFDKQFYKETWLFVDFSFLWEISDYSLFTTLSSSNPVLLSNVLLKTTSEHSPIIISAVVKTTRFPKEKDDFFFWFQNNILNAKFHQAKGLFKYELKNVKVERNWVFATNSNFTSLYLCNLIVYFKLRLTDLREF